MHKNQTVRDPFHCGLSQAAQWYHILQVEVEKQVNSPIQQCQLLVKPTIKPPLAPSSPPSMQQDGLS